MITNVKQNYFTKVTNVNYIIITFVTKINTYENTNFEAYRIRAINVI
jgi:hypothetical protein